MYQRVFIKSTCLCFRIGYAWQPGGAGGSLTKGWTLAYSSRNGTYLDKFYNGRSVLFIFPLSVCITYKYFKELQILHI